MATKAQTEGNRAQAIMDDPVVKKAFSTLEAYWKDQIAESEPSDTQGREMAYLKIRALGDFRTALTAFIQNGKIEADKAKKQKKANQ